MSGHPQSPSLWSGSGVPPPPVGQAPAFAWEAQPQQQQQQGPQQASTIPSAGASVHSPRRTPIASPNGAIAQPQHSPRVLGLSTGPPVQHHQPQYQQSQMQPQPQHQQHASAVSYTHHLFGDGSMAAASAGTPGVAFPALQPQMMPQQQHQHLAHMQFMQQRLEPEKRQLAMQHQMQLQQMQQWQVQQQMQHPHQHPKQQPMAMPGGGGGAWPQQQSPSPPPAAIAATTVAQAHPHFTAASAAHSGANAAAIASASPPAAASPVTPALPMSPRFSDASLRRGAAVPELGLDASALDGGESYDGEDEPPLRPVPSPSSQPHTSSSRASVSHNRSQDAPLNAVTPAASSVTIAATANSPLTPAPVPAAGGPAASPPLLYNPSPSPAAPVSSLPAAAVPVSATAATSTGQADASMSDATAAAFPPAISAAAAPSSSPDGGSDAHGDGGVLNSSFDADVWLLMLQQLYHSPAPWAREMAYTMFQNLQQEAITAVQRQQQQQQQLQQQQQQQAAGSHSRRLLPPAGPSASVQSLLAVDWTGAARPLSLDEFMARRAAGAFPPDYLARLLRELVACKEREAAAAAAAAQEENNNLLLAEGAAANAAAASPLRRKPALMPGTGHSLLGTVAGKNGSSSGLWESGGRALLPSMRPRAASGPGHWGSGSLLHLLRARETGGALWRPRQQSSSSNGSANGAQQAAGMSVPAVSALSLGADGADLYARSLRRLKVVTGHTHPVYCVTMDRTGSRVLTGSDDNTLKIWDSASGRLLATCRGHASEITEIAVSPDNTLVASASCDSRIRLWDLNGTPVGVLTGHSADATRVVFNPDYGVAPHHRRLLVSISLDGTARIWDVANLAGAPIVVSSSSTRRVAGRSWPSAEQQQPYIPQDLELLALAGDESEESGRRVAPSWFPSTSSLHSTLNPEFICISFHPMGGEFVCGHNDYRLRVYDARPPRSNAANTSASANSGAGSSQLLSVLSGHRAEVNVVSYSGEGSRILSVAGDGEVLVWTRVEFEEIQQAAAMVDTKLPTQPPQSLWAHDDATPLPQANFYAGLRRALPASSPPPPPSSGSAAASSAASAVASMAASISSSSSSSGSSLPTHRYILLARLHSFPPPAAGLSNSAASLNADTAAAVALSGKTSLASWSLHDDSIIGSIPGAGVVQWVLPPLVRDQRTGQVKLDRQDPFMAQHLLYAEHSKNISTRSAGGAGGRLATTVKPASASEQRSTGRSKRSPAGSAVGGSAAASGAAVSAAAASAADTLPAMNFLSCFRRPTLTPRVRFSVHSKDADVVVLARHPSLADLFVSAGSDGRVVLYDVARKRVLRVMRESIPSSLSAAAAAAGPSGVHGGARVPVNFVDGLFTPAASHSGGHVLALSTDLGQLFLFGCGVDQRKYLLAPEQQFFVRDYLAVQRDQHDNVLDVDSQCPPHLAPGATTLCDLNLHVYAQPLPPVPPLRLHALPVTPPLPARAPVPVRTFAAGEEPRHSTYIPLDLVSAGPPPTTEEERLREQEATLWRTAVPAVASRAQMVEPDRSPGTMAALYSAQQRRDAEAHRFEYELRVAWQQQREVIRVANRLEAEAERAALRSGRTRSGSAAAGARVTIAPTWYPLLGLPLPSNAPLLSTREDEAAATAAAYGHASDEEAARDETQLYRSCTFNAQGLVRRARPLIGSTTAAAAAVPASSRVLFGAAGRQSSLSALRNPGESPTRPSRSHRAGGGSASAAAGARPASAAASASSNIHTLGSSRRRPIAVLDENDDDYRDDDYGPGDDHEDDAADGEDGTATRTQRRNARAQGRALRRFEELKQDDSARATVAAAEEDDEKSVGDGGVAGGADGASSVEHSEYSGAEGGDAARGADGSGSSSDSLASDSDDAVNLSDGNNSDGSYDLRRDEPGWTNSRKRKRDAASGGRGGGGAAASAFDSRRSDRRSRSSRSSRNRSRSGRAQADSSLRRSKRARHTQEWSDAEDDDEEEDEDPDAYADEEEKEEAERARRQREARARKRQQQGDGAAAAAGGSSSVSFSQRSSAQRARRYQDTGSDEEARLFAEEQGDYAERIMGGAEGDAEQQQQEDGQQEPSELDRILAPESNWLERPQAQVYNSSYTPQLGDEVVYARVGHEATLARQTLLPRSHPPRKELPTFLACLVARVEYLWSQDALAPPSKLASANPYERLPLTHTGEVDSLALRRMQQPLVFARITLVPLADAHLIRNNNHPYNLVGNNDGSPQSAFEDADADMASSSHLRFSASPSFDFTSLPPPERWFELVSRSDTRLRLRRVPKPDEEANGQTQPPALSAAAAVMAAAAAATSAGLGLSVVKEEKTTPSPPSEEFAMVGGRRKRTLRGQADGVAAAAATLAAAAAPASPLMLPSSQPVRQSIRSAILQSLHDAPPQSQQQSSSSRTRIVLRRSAGGHHSVAEASVKDEREEEDDAVPDDALAEDDHALALKLQQQQALQPRASSRQRVPKKPDPYEVTIATQPPQYATSRVRHDRPGNGIGGMGASASARGVSARETDDRDLPDSSFVVDLFEPQDADWLVLASRFRACPGMARWAATSADVDQSIVGTPAAEIEGNNFLASLPSTNTASGSADAAASSAAPRRAHEWSVGDRFKMKFCDQSEWSTGVVLGNTLHDHEREQVLAAAAAARVTRHQLKTSVSPSGGAGGAPAVTPWACLRVSWKSEAEIDALLDAQEAARASALVAEPSLPAAQMADPEAARAHRRLQLLAQMDAEEFVSPWEIDAVDRPQTEMDDIDTFEAAMSSRSSEDVDNNAVAMSLAAPSNSGRICKSELVHVSEPDVLLDVSEHLRPALTARLLRVVKRLMGEDEGKDDDEEGEGGDERFDPFVERVSRAHFPDYSHVVPYAVSLRTLARRLSQRFYRTVAALAHDVRAMSLAARRYNAPRSAIVEQVALLERRLLRAIFVAAPKEFSVLITPSGKDTHLDWSAAAAAMAATAQDDEEDDDEAAEAELREGIARALDELRAAAASTTSGDDQVKLEKGDKPAAAASSEANLLGSSHTAVDVSSDATPAPMDLDDAESTAPAAAPIAAVAPLLAPLPSTEDKAEAMDAQEHKNAGSI